MNFIQIGARLINLSNVTLIWLNQNQIHFHFTNNKAHVAEYETNELAAQHFKNILP